MQKLLIFRPNIGDFVFGQTFNTDWIRGYVVALIPYLKIAMIDQARIVFVLKLATCKPPLLDMPALGGLCELTDATHKLKVRCTVSNMLLRILYVTS